MINERKEETGGEPMEKTLAKCISFVEGNIADKAKLEELYIDTIVNAANPTLMGSTVGVDGAIHGAIDKLNEKEGYFKEEICKCLHTDVKEKRTRCQRGSAVVTPGYGLCQYVIHVVGAECDGKDSGFRQCSSSMVQTLESCYEQIVEQIKEHADMVNIAIPIIGSGEYKVPFRTAAKIAVSSVYNAIAEWKRKDPEMFAMSGLQGIYFFVYDSDPQCSKERVQTGNEILKEYTPVMEKENQIIFQTSWQAHLRSMAEVRNYDRARGYFSIAGNVRKALMWIRIPFVPIMWLKDLFGGRNWEKRRQFVEWFTIAKMLISILLCFLVRYEITTGCPAMEKVVFTAIVIYLMSDTITYLLSLIVFADIQGPTANVTRSLILLLINYTEVTAGMAYLYFAHCGEKIGLKAAVAFGIWSETCEEVDSTINYVFQIANGGIKFFFLTIVLGYFSGHMHQKKFRN